MKSDHHDKWLEWGVWNNCKVTLEEEENISFCHVGVKIVSQILVVPCSPQSLFSHILFCKNFWQVLHKKIKYFFSCVFNESQCIDRHFEAKKMSNPMFYEFDDINMFFKQTYFTAFTELTFYIPLK